MWNSWQQDILPKHEQNFDLIKGSIHGIADVGLNSLEGLTTLGYLTSISDYSFNDRMQSMELFHQDIACYRTPIENAITHTLNPSNPALYHSTRSLTTTTIELATIATGIYNIGKISRTPTRIASYPNRILNTPHITKKAQIWTSTKRHTSVENAFKHWRNHGHEFPELINSKQYVEATRNFVKHPPMSTIKKIRTNGDILFYNPPSNTFAIINKQGFPRTMYKPNVNKHPYPTNMDYFNAQQ